VFQNYRKLTFLCHPEDFSPKDLIFWFFNLKRKNEILRFAQNDDVDFWNSLSK
jgi:hypothetical protein